MAGMGVELALSTSQSMSAIRNSADGDERVYLLRKQNKRRKRLSKAGKLLSKDEDISVPYRLGRKVSSIFQRKDNTAPGSPLPFHSERSALQPLEFKDLPRVLGRHPVVNPLGCGRLEPRTEVYMQPRGVQTLPSDSSMKGGWMGILNDTSSFSDDSLLGSIPYVGYPHDQLPRRNLRSQMKEHNISPPQSSSTTLAEEMEGRQSSEDAEEVRPHNRGLRRTQKSQQLFDNDTGLYNDTYDIRYEHNKANSARRLLLKDDNYSADGESSYNSSRGWRNSEKPSPTFDDEGRSLPLLDNATDPQDVSKYRSVQIFNAAIDACGECNTKDFSAIQNWYERYTRGNLNFKKMEKMPCECAINYLLAILSDDEYERMRKSSIFDILWAKWDTATAEHQIRKAMGNYKVDNAALSFFDGDYEIVRAENGYDLRRIDRLMSLAAHALYTGEVIWVLDTKKDWRFMNNPLVVGEPNIRFFAAAPLLMYDDTTVGVFYIFDRKPRTHFSSKERSELQAFASLLLVDMAMQRAHLTDPHLDNLPLPDDSMSFSPRIDTPDPASVADFSPSPIRFYKDTPLPTYFSKGVDETSGFHVAKMPANGLSTPWPMTQTRSIAPSGYHGTDVANEVPLLQEDLSAVRQLKLAQVYRNSVDDFLSLTDEDCQEMSECDNRPPAPSIRAAESVVSIANSTKSKYALKMEPAPLRLNKTPRFEDAPRFPCPLSQPVLVEPALPRRASMISFRDKIMHEESLSQEEDQPNPRQSFVSNATDETSESLRYELSPLLDRDSIQPPYRKSSLPEKLYIKRVGTPQSGTVRAAIASLNGSLNGSVKGLTKPTLADRFPSREYPVLAVQTATDNSRAQDMLASESPSDDGAESPTITEGSELGSNLDRTITPDNGELGLADQSGCGTATISSSPSISDGSLGSPTILANVMDNNSSGSRVNIATPSNSSFDSSLDMSESIDTINATQSDHSDPFYLEPKIRYTAVPLAREDLLFLRATARFPSAPSQTSSSSITLPKRDTRPQIIEALPSPPPTTPLPIPNARSDSFDENILSNAAQLCRAAAQALAYDLIYVADITAPKHNSLNPTRPSDITIRFLVAHGMDSVPPLGPKLHLDALRSHGVYTWVPPTDSLNPSDFNIGLLQAIPTSFGSTRIRNCGILVAALRRVSTPPIASEKVQLKQFEEFVTKMKGILMNPVKFKSKIPQRKASSPALLQQAQQTSGFREEIGFLANEATEVTAIPSPMTTPEVQPSSRFKGVVKKKSLATIGTVASRAKRTHTPVIPRPRGM